MHVQYLNEWQPLTLIIGTYIYDDALKNVKMQGEFKHFKEAMHSKLTTVFDVSSLFYDLQLKRYFSSAKTIVVSEHANRQLPDDRITA